MATEKQRCLYCQRVIQVRQGHDCPQCESGPYHRGCLREHHVCGGTPDIAQAFEGFGNRHED